MPLGEKICLVFNILVRFFHGSGSGFCPDQDTGSGKKYDPDSGHKDPEPKHWKKGTKKHTHFVDTISRPDWQKRNLDKPLKQHW